MIIQDLFEKRTQLMVNCLRYIYLSNSFVTIVNLSERLNVNRKQRIVFLMNCKNQSASNQNQKALGCSFSGNKNIYFDIQHEIYNQSVIYQVIENCLLSKN